ncbi:hypothetical protein M3Y95_01127100 [Aphelenchoides besseyi]|nr:hypothetical protein M3Y95_01127100 [Aphelenchoides besseyi]
MVVNQTIRVSYMKDFPFFNAKCSHVNHRVGSTCQFPGMTSEILNLIVTYLNLTMEVVKVSPFVPTWNNTFDEVYNNETDLYALFYNEHTKRYVSKFDFTKPIFWHNIKVLIKKPDHSFKSIFDFFQMYSVDIWLSMIAVFMLFTSFAVLVHHIECQLQLRKRYDIGNIVWKMTGIQLTQLNGISYKLRSGKMSLLAFSVFQIYIFVGLYQSLILTRIIKKVESAPFLPDEFPQLIKDKKLTLYLDSHEARWLLEEIKNNLDSPFYELREALQFNPYKVVNDVLKAIDEERGAVTLYVENFWSTDKAEAHCNLILVDAHFLPQPERFMLRKGSDFVRIFNEAIDVNVYQINRIILKYLVYKPISKCPTQPTGATSLSLTPYYGLLLLFSIGIAASGCAFVKEMMRTKKSRQRTVLQLIRKTLQRH